MSQSTTQHRCDSPKSVRCAVVTVSDTRSLETDRGGKLVADLLAAGGHSVAGREIVRDDPREIEPLVRRLADALPPGGRLLIHDVFLNDAMDGPLPVALYSAALFSVTEGRAYSGAEYRSFMAEAGLAPQPVVPTLVHCGLLAGVKSVG